MEKYALAVKGRTVELVKGEFPLNVTPGYMFERMPERALEIWAVLKVFSYEEIATLQALETLIGFDSLSALFKVANP